LRWLAGLRNGGQPASTQIKVSVMHRNAYLLNRYLDPETGGWITGYLRSAGYLAPGESLNGFEGKTFCGTSNEKR